MQAVRDFSYFKAECTLTLGVLCPGGAYFFLFQFDSNAKSLLTLGVLCAGSALCFLFQSRVPTQPRRALCSMCVILPLLEPNPH